MDLHTIGGEPVVVLDSYTISEEQGPAGAHPSGFAVGTQVTRVGRFASVDVVAADTIDAPATPPAPAPVEPDAEDTAEGPESAATTSGSGTVSASFSGGSL